jgi:Saccharopine dehydrogenase C-terminal domain
MAASSFHAPGIEHGNSSMSRTVSFPAASGVHLSLTGKITTPGVLRPVTPGIHHTILDELAAAAIASEETTGKVWRFRQQKSHGWRHDSPSLRAATGPAAPPW